jgi:hypothetical protein
MLLAIQVLTPPSARPHSITELVHTFRATRSPRILTQLAVSILRQGRALELLYGGWCSALHSPSTVHPPEDAAALDGVLRRTDEFARHAVVFRGQLLREYGGLRGVRDLPAGFASARRESVWLEDGRLILGEYGEGARLACITEHGCVVNDHYARVPGVRHIHAVQKYGGPGEFLVATGDGAKRLDLWTVRGTEMRFVRQIGKRLTGYTAVARIGGELYLGTDFSGRPNFLQVLGGARYFFPEKAYRMHAAAFHVLSDRYLVSVNKELDVSGGRRALCVFDTRARRFIHCDYIPSSSTPTLSSSTPLSS